MMGTFDDGADMLESLKSVSQEKAQTQFLDWVWRRLRIDEINAWNFQDDMKAVKKRLNALEGKAVVKPDYPRCATCLHWAGNPDKTMRYACRKMEDGQPVISCNLHGETRYFPVELTERPISITTRPDFGCVQHSELTGAKNNG